jgi:hypothetical protein
MKVIGAILESDVDVNDELLVRTHAILLEIMSTNAGAALCAAVCLGSIARRSPDLVRLQVPRLVADFVGAIGVDNGELSDVCIQRLEALAAMYAHSFAGFTRAVYEAVLHCYATIPQPQSEEDGEEQHIAKHGLFHERRAECLRRIWSGFLPTSFAQKTPRTWSAKLSKGVQQERNMGRRFRASCWHYWSSESIRGRRLRDSLRE